MQQDDDDFSHSVAWETNPTSTSSSHSHPHSTPTPHSPSTPSASLNPDSDPYSAYSTHSQSLTNPDSDHTDAATRGGPSTAANDGLQSVRNAQVKDGKVELEGTSDTFVSYLVTAQVRLFPLPSLPTSPHRTTHLSLLHRPTSPSTRRTPRQHGGASTTLSSSVTPSRATFPPASCRLCRKSIEWVRSEPPCFSRAFAATPD